MRERDGGSENVCVRKWEGGEEEKCEKRLPIPSVNITHRKLAGSDTLSA